MDEDFNVDSDDEGGGNEWLATYGDLVTLLLCFFVLLFAMSTVDAQKFRSVAASFSGGSSVGMNTGGDSVLELLELGTESVRNEQKQKEEEMNKLYEEVKKLLAQEGLNSEITVEQTERGILLTFRDDMLFDRGKAILRPEVKRIVSSFGNILRTYDKKIRIVGHTDNIPIKNSEFKSNWELSTSRAISVVKYFTEEVAPSERINPDNFEVAGVADNEPVAPNDTEVNRQKNRRIEIIVLK